MGTDLCLQLNNMSGSHLWSKCHWRYRWGGDKLKDWQPPVCLWRLVSCSLVTEWCLEPPCLCLTLNFATSLLFVTRNLHNFSKLCCLQNCALGLRTGYIGSNLRWLKLRLKNTLGKILSQCLTHSKYSEMPALEIPEPGPAYNHEQNLNQIHSLPCFWNAKFYETEIV